MKLRLLDKKELSQGKGCLLCKASLKEYIDSLKEGFNEYDIQRNIVDNKYLDTIFDTIVNNEHIPIITLVIENKIDIYDTDVEVGEFRILDGLQRTWRLNGILLFVSWLEQNYQDMDSLKKGFIDISMRSIPLESRKKILEMGISDLKQARKIAEKIYEIGSYNKIVRHFEDNTQWFELWYGLSHNEIIYKMLLLNAGHKTMSPRHQVELLFYNWLDTFSKASDVKIVREREESSVVTFVKNRNPRTYKFSDLVLATLSFQNGKINEIQSNIIEKSFNSYDTLLVNSENVYYTDLIRFIADLDDIICNHYGDDGRLWYGRENNLEALTAAVGRWCMNQENNLETNKCLSSCLDIFSSRIEDLCLRDFDLYKDRLAASRVNIGQKTKAIVYEAILDFLNNTGIVKWGDMFTY